MKLDFMHINRIQAIPYRKFQLWMIVSVYQQLLLVTSDLETNRNYFRYWIYFSYMKYKIVKQENRKTINQI